MKGSKWRRMTAAVLLVLASVGVQAQQFKQIYTIRWEMGLPLGKYKQFVSEFSLRGISAEAHFFVLEHFSLGGQVSWSSFYKNNDVMTYYPNSSTALTAKMFNAVEDIPIMLHATYHILPDYRIRPYISLGLGAVYTLHTISFQDLMFSEKKWGFGMCPEVGFYVPMGNIPLALNVFVNYLVSFSSYTYMEQVLNPFQSLNFGLGLSFIVD